MPLSIPGSQQIARIIYCPSHTPPGDDERVVLWEMLVKPYLLLNHFLPIMATFILHGAGVECSHVYPFLQGTMTFKVVMGYTAARGYADAWGTFVGVVAGHAAFTSLYGFAEQNGATLQ